MALDTGLIDIQDAPAHVIGEGTSESQRNIIAKGPGFTP